MGGIILPAVGGDHFTRGQAGSFYQEWGGGGGSG